MNDYPVKRISRLTAIAAQLQAKRMVTAVALAAKFGVSVRTIYRDMKTLEEAGIPVLTIEGKGYTLMEGYRIPPIMFTESEAHALATIEQLLLGRGEPSLRRAYVSAIDKVRAVLQYPVREKAVLLAGRIALSPALAATDADHSLLMIQQALTAFEVLEISYRSAHEAAPLSRKVEPFGLYYSQEERWLLIAYCRLRKDFRMFRLDRMATVRSTGLNFQPHKLTLEQYLDQKRKNFQHP